jgi:hypothetical protein
MTEELKKNGIIPDVENDFKVELSLKVYIAQSLSIMYLLLGRLFIMARRLMALSSLQVVCKLFSFYLFYTSSSTPS